MLTRLSLRQDRIRKILFSLGLLSLFFVDYGSLIPFEFSDRSFSDVWWSFLSSGRKVNVSHQDIVTNVLLAVPLAFFLFGAFVRTIYGLTNTVLVFVIMMFCIANAAVIEVLQGFLPTRTPNLIDVLSQGFGSLIGMGLWVFAGNKVCGFLDILISHFQQYENKRSVSKFSFSLLCLAYLLLLLMMNGYFSNELLSLSVAEVKIADIHLVPFYGHYFASTIWATSSVLQYFAMYLPTGFACWLWQNPSGKQYTHQLRLKWAIFLAINLALLMESGKLFLAEKNPDTTNVILAITASVAAFIIWPCLAGVRDNLGNEGRSLTNDSINNHKSGFSPGRWIALAIWGMTFVALIFFPLGTWWLSLVFSIYLYTLLKFPTSWLILVPALLPVLDLAPWSGRFFLNEFDLLLLTTLAAGLWNAKPLSSSQIHLAKRVKLVLLLFFFSVLISLLIGLLPLANLDFNAFSNYFSRYNSLLAAKGFLEAVAFIPLLIQAINFDYDLHRSLSFGMVLGLTAAVTAGVWERVVFPGLFDFTSTFRISALFSSMHTGDSPVEAYLVSALPFTLAWAYLRKSWGIAILALLLFMAGVYALFVTFARGGYAAFVVSILILMIGVVFNSGRTNGRKTLLLPALAFFVFCAGLVALPVLQGSFAKARLAMIDEDMDVRLGHWRNVLNIADTDWGTKTFGMGLGRFPETYFFRNPTGQYSATYQIHDENQNSYLSMGTGEIIYVEQIVPVLPRQEYHLKLDIRPNAVGAGFNVMLCERTFFKSYNCQNFSRSKLNHTGEWQNYQTELNSGVLGQGAWFNRRTVKLILENVGSGVAFDVDNIQLLDASGNDVLTNGDFSKGMDRWFFSAFNHLAWHVKNIFVQLIFEQGWFGLLTFGALVAVLLFSVGRAALKGQVMALTTASSLVGFLCVGLFGSPLDSPRMAFLFYFLLFSGYLTCLVRREAKVASRLVRGQERMELLQRNAQVEIKVVKSTDSPPDRFSIKNDKPARRVEFIERSNTVFCDNRITFKQFLPLISGLITLTLILAAVLNSPVTPYNIRELIHESHPWLALVLLSLLIIWTFGFPVVITCLMVKPVISRFYPLLLLSHGLLGWMLLIIAVPLESIHDIVGSPVMNWGWHWEIAGRFIALYSLLSLTATLVFLVVNKVVFSSLLGPALSVWILTAILVYPVCYNVIVSNAATDNLIELMEGGGSIGAVFFLSVFWALLNLSGYGLALSVMLKNKLLEVLFSLAFIGLPLGYWLINQGLEVSIVKFNSVFSGLQFLLSTDRQHYLRGSDLLGRYVVFHAAIVLAMMFIDYIVLRSLKNLSPNRFCLSR